MSINRQIKKHTSQSLKGNRITAVCAVLIIFLLIASTIFIEKFVTDITNNTPYVSVSLDKSIGILSDIPNISYNSFYITAMIIMVHIFIIKPLWMGFRKMTVRIVMGKDGDFGHLFYYFRNAKLYSKSILLDFYIFLRRTAVCVLFITPGIIAIIFDQIFDYSGVLTRFVINGRSFSIVTLMGIILFVLGMVIAWIYSTKYFLSVYFFICIPEMSVWKCVRQSIKYTRGQVSDLFGFKISFFPLMISSVIILPVFYLIPYYVSCCSAYAMCVRKKEKIREIRK